MQQYFYEEKLDLLEVYPLNDEILHHMKNVLRKKDGYKFRLVDKTQTCYLCELEDDKAKVVEKIEEDHELDINVTVIMSLIKSDKFELTLQKLTELGVKRIVPYNANRSIIKIKDEKHKLERYRKIVMEASEQSHRDIVPEITNIIGYKDLDKFLSKYNFVAYEKNQGNYIDYHTLDGSITYIIGPEGGFEIQEIENFEKLGFECKSLGKRILRAETAAIFVISNIVGASER